MTNQPLTLFLCGDWPAEEQAIWLTALQAALPEGRWLTELSPADAAEVRVAVVANPPPGRLKGLPRLALVQSLWAGVDRLLADPTVPNEVPLLRMVDPAMNTAMAETALWAVLSLHRGFFGLAAQQRAGLWQGVVQRRADELSIAVLGQGQMGRAVTVRLQAQGYRVSGWQRGADAERARGELHALLAHHEIIINLLPLTPATRGLLDRAAFAAMPRGASLVNLARGAHVVEADLLQALDTGHLAHAVLDVFATEPLPAEHPFWCHPQVTVLPHVAAQTDPRSAAAVVAAQVRGWRRGEPLAHPVDRLRGY